MRQPNTSRWICLTIAGMAICACFLWQGCNQGLADPYMPQERSTGGLDTEIVVDLGSRAFGFSTSPTALAIWAASSGGNAPRSGIPIYKVYGDGRVEKQFPQQQPQTVSQLGTEGVAGLLELAVAGGLMEWDPDSVQTRVLNAVGGGYSNPDASTQKIKIFLTFYRDIEGGESRPATRVIESPDSRLRSQLVPEIQELQAIWGIFRTLLEAGR